MTMMRSVILATGSYLPDKALTNADMAKLVDTNDAWIVQRTGIKQRHIAAEGQAEKTTYRRSISATVVRNSELLVSVRKK